MAEQARVRVPEARVALAELPLEAGLVASLAAVCGFAGGLLGGIFSDRPLRRGHSLSFARKLPIVCGLLLSTSIVLCNSVDTQWIVVALMALAFFGKGLGALGWAVLTDTSPRDTAGLSGRDIARLEFSR